MRRHFAQPLHAGIFHRGVGAEAFSDGVADDGLALFLEQLNQPLLLLDQGINLRRFVVEEGGDGQLFFYIWNRTTYITQ